MYDNQLIINYYNNILEETRKCWNEFAIQYGHQPITPTKHPAFKSEDKFARYLVQKVYDLRLCFVQFAHTSNVPSLIRQTQMEIQSMSTSFLIQLLHTYFKQGIRIEWHHALNERNIGGRDLPGFNLIIRLMFFTLYVKNIPIVRIQMLIKDDRSAGGDQNIRLRFMNPPFVKIVRVELFSSPYYFYLLLRIVLMFLQDEIFQLFDLNVYHDGDQTGPKHTKLDLHFEKFLNERSDLRYVYYDSARNTILKLDTLLQSDTAKRAFEVARYLKIKELSNTERRVFIKHKVINHEKYMRIPETFELQDTGDEETDHVILKIFRMFDNQVNLKLIEFDGNLDNINLYNEQKYFKLYLRNEFVIELYISERHNAYRDTPDMHVPFLDVAQVKSNSTSPYLTYLILRLALKYFHNKITDITQYYSIDINPYSGIDIKFNNLSTHDAIPILDAKLSEPDAQHFFEEMQIKPLRDEDEIEKRIPYSTAKDISLKPLMQ
jgi:hypothetical protein